MHWNDQFSVKICRIGTANSGRNVLGLWLNTTNHPLFLSCDSFKNGQKAGPCTSLSWHNFKKMYPLGDTYGVKLHPFPITFQQKWKNSACEFVFYSFLKFFTQNQGLLWNCYFTSYLVFATNSKRREIESRGFHNNPWFSVKNFKNE